MKFTWRAKSACTIFYVIRVYHAKDNVGDKSADGGKKVNFMQVIQVSCV